jgi:hypothetical protein
MFVEAVRRHLDALPSAQTGWLAWLGDHSRSRLALPIIEVERFRYLRAENEPVDGRAIRQPPFMRLPWLQFMASLRPHAWGAVGARDRRRRSAVLRGCRGSRELRCARACPSRSPWLAVRSCPSWADPASHSRQRRTSPPRPRALLKLRPASTRYLCLSRSL